MSTSGNLTKWQKQYVGCFFKVWLSIAFIFVLLNAIFYITGVSRIGSTVQLVEFNICLNDNVYEPVTEVPEGTRVLFICGVAEGEGSGGGSWYLYRHEQMIRDRAINYYEGTFFDEVRFGEGLISGHYRLDIVSARRIIAETEFNVVEGVVPEI